jgi:hypothetical protein
MNVLNNCTFLVNSWIETKKKIKILHDGQIISNLFLVEGEQVAQNAHRFGTVFRLVDKSVGEVLERDVI